MKRPVNLCLVTHVLTHLHRIPIWVYSVRADGASSKDKALILGRSSKGDLLALPEEVVDVFGYALYLAQIGKKHEQAKPLKGFGSAGVLEVVEDWQGNAYRAVYTVRFRCGVFVLHVFQKKAKRGVARQRLIWI